MIFKYALPIQDEVDLSLPKGSKILRIECQGNEPKVWAMVPRPPEYVPNEIRKIKIFGTGPQFSIPEHLDYLATFQHQNFVWHVFEDLNGAKR